MGQMSDSQPKTAKLSIGQLRRQVVLDTEAVYRVCTVTPTLVQVEVVRAPGLAPGHRFQFTCAAVLGMDVVESGDDAAKS